MITTLKGWRDSGYDFLIYYSEPENTRYKSSIDCRISNYYRNTVIWTRIYYLKKIINKKKKKLYKRNNKGIKINQIYLMWIISWSW